MKTLKLEAFDGELVLPGGEPLIALFPSGASMTPRWPNPDPETLRAALQDAREMGAIWATTASVILPDGKKFLIGDPPSNEYPPRETFMDRPRSWDISFEDAADGCMPAGWYAQGLNGRGWPITSPFYQLYGPFQTESEAADAAKAVDESYFVS